LARTEIKPDIVFFGEGLPARFNDLQQADFAKCDLLIVMGTSLQVYPFAGLVTKAAANVPRLVCCLFLVTWRYCSDAVLIFLCL
jgi:NAD-dependent SIR2 family protein deacetylase